MKTSILVAAVVSAVALVGCGTKGADCETFSKVANANVETMKKSDPKDPKALEAMIKAVADGAKSVQVKDEGLAALVKEYAAVWDKSANAAKELESTDEAVVKKALAEVESTEKSESAIVDKINAYCK